MTERAITLATTDAGDVTLPEPAWCVGHHDDYQPGFRVDIFHRGPDHGVTFRGHTIGDAALVLYPFAASPGPGVTVSLLGNTLDAVGLYDLAAALDRHADQLRALADELSALRGGEGQ
ncbi:DUF6907 domain-containing protein [Streptomyces sp. NPDC127105]|uniref:DUF6907 domain-containing protein n=1 Tax=Streptomyces sp. NPDC127105 TaxID=3345359 RepID=UPI00364FD484